MPAGGKAGIIVVRRSSRRSRHSVGRSSLLLRPRRSSISSGIRRSFGSRIRSGQVTACLERCPSPASTAGASASSFRSHGYCPSRAMALWTVPCGRLPRGLSKSRKGESQTLSEVCRVVTNTAGSGPISLRRSAFSLLGAMPGGTKSPEPPSWRLHPRAEKAPDESLKIATKGLGFHPMVHKKLYGLYDEDLTRFLPHRRIPEFSKRLASQTARRLE